MMASDFIVLRALEIRYCVVILGIVQKCREIDVITFGIVISVDAILKDKFKNANDLKHQK